VARTAADLRETADMIAFRHSIFALPFAVVSLITAADPGWPTWRAWFWVVVAMVSARTAAMAYNRLADHEFDAANPRTAGRSLPAGRLSRRFAWGVTGVAAVVFVMAAANLNRTCLLLAPPTLVVLFGYSYAKRFTAVAHLWLGLALGLAPLGSWIAVTASLDVAPLVLAAAVTLWVAGFDVIYSLQDESFDREHGLRSVPAAVGGQRSLAIARLFHGGALVGFAVFAAMAGGGWLRATAVVAAGGLLVWQHRLITPGNLRAVDAAFFTANGSLSILMCLLFVAARATGW
jgi:4-hydroxybenzoate polyprenyltransferase